MMVAGEFDSLEEQLLANSSSMNRFSSFEHVPTETRRILRDRFASKLRVVPWSRFIDPDREVTSDDLVLRLLADLRISSNADWSLAEAAYVDAQPSANEPADLQAVADLGWLRRIWGRVEIERDLRVAIWQAPAGVMDALKLLLSALDEWRYETGGGVREVPELRKLVEAIEVAANNSHEILARTPGWVAARLWERILAQETTADSALRRWMDLWRFLDSPSIVPRAAWGAPDAKTFREAAFRVLTTEQSLGGWAETRDLYVRKTALAQSVTTANAESRFPQPPDTLVDRALWLQSRVIEAHAYDSMAICRDLFGLARLLLADVEAEEHSPAPHAAAAQIVDLAIDRAELFIYLLFRVQACPRLLADLVLYPPSSGLACLLIAQWRSPTGAWDRLLVERDHIDGQAEAFADAVSILGVHMRKGQAHAGEAAALLSWLHGRAGPGFIDDVGSSDLLVATLRSEIARCANPIVLAMVQSLDGPGLHLGVGASEFAAVLDLSDLGGIEDEVDANAIVIAYANSIATGDYTLSTHRIGASGAVTLARISERTPELRTKFLYPQDVRARLTAETNQDNELIIQHSIGRSLRAHIRILCRAIIGGAGDVPADLFEALTTAVRTGALHHQEKGRVAAFAPHFENHVVTPNSDRPLAADLAATLALLSRDRQEALLAVILETDEPLILAQLLSRSPPRLRPDIEGRIAAIAPIDAGAIHSLPEMQARIDELLTAGAGDAAARYMAAEIDLKTMGPIPGREVVRFRNQVRLLFLREDWAAIMAMVIPNFSSSHDRDVANETLRQFRALALIKGPKPNPASAKALFANLFDERPSLGFATNWLAAEIGDLLHADSFGMLNGENIRRGQKAIAEVERMTSLLPAASFDEALECNRALLMLALAEPSQALAILSAVTFVRLQDTAAAYRAIALARLGRQSEATAALDVAEHTIGRTDVLAAARSHIASGAQFLSVPGISLHEDLVKNVTAAISRFRLMNPTEQARVIQQGTDPFEALLIDYVRAAADAVVSLVPMMKGVQIDSVEDDLTAFVQQLLAARVHFLGWSVSDQSKGGFSGKGNAGERDLLVSWGSSVLALIEAVICSRPLTQDAMKADLESHFQKLLGYGSPRIFFHLTYAYLEDKQSLMQFLVVSAKTVSPPGFTYRGHEPIPHEDSRPPGFVARYAADFGEVKVVFLVLNLGQQRQRRAAKAAAATKVRTAPRKRNGLLPNAIPNGPDN